MNPPDESALESGLEDRPAPEPADDGGLTGEGAVILASDTHDTAMESPAKDTTASGVSFADNMTTSTERRRVNRHDVKQIFRASTTTGAVTVEQIKRIKRMHDKISGGVDFNFNYYCLLMVASVVAGLGLATDSATTVISSMLLSPIMGPVIGMSYGTIIGDKRLFKRSARNEVISIVICVCFGLLIGLCTFWTPMADEWPTHEMLSRGTRTTFLAGIPIAFFSGLGVALSVLDDSTSSLVGVAISASLLPPAVNCGMLFIVAWFKGEQWDDFSFKYEETPVLYELFLDKYPVERNTFSQMAIMSLFLTVANVIMVAIGATLMFRAKEVLPVRKKVFWDDLKIARRVFQGRALDETTGEVLDPVAVAKMLSEEIENEKTE